MEKGCFLPSLASKNLRPQSRKKKGEEVGAPAAAGNAKICHVLSGGDATGEGKGRGGEEWQERLLFMTGYH